MGGRFNPPGGALNRLAPVLPSDGCRLKENPAVDVLVLAIKLKPVLD